MLYAGQHVVFDGTHWGDGHTNWLVEAWAVPS